MCIISLFFVICSKKIFMKTSTYIVRIEVDNLIMPWNIVTLYKCTYKVWKVDLKLVYGFLTLENDGVNS